MMKQVYMPQPKTASEKLRDNALYMMVGYLAYIIFEKFFGFIFNIFSGSPFEAKQKAREDRNDRLELQKKDPMNQFQARFIDDVESYIGDPDNAAYKAWFEDWKAGNVIDSDLRWAPPETFKEDLICSSFLQYMKIQLDLHKSASIFKKMKFSKTLRAYYPELRCSLRGLEKDLAEYEMELISIDAVTTLKTEIANAGLSEELAEHLAGQDLSSKELKDKINALKKLKLLGYSDEACLVGLEHNLNKVALTRLDVVLKQYGLPVKVGLAYAMGSLSLEDVKTLKENTDGYIERWGSDFMFSIAEGNTKTVYEEFLDEDIKKLRSNKFVRSLL